ncbi:MAG: DUF3703 domain-containing protein [Reichenbachiella sp.]|uniref:DUF3703 domain-containing protein n=1 Tax=Reichenbachiella sp. TaxID=2184521 RepID=UPI003264DCE2
MKLNLSMPSKLFSFYSQELTNYRLAKIANDSAQVWHHLERAHIIGQAYPIQHTQTHWLMLMQGWQEKRFNEVLGQAIRLVFGGPLSFINYFPKGNPGSIRVSMMKPEALPEDIAQFFRDYT